MTRVWVVFISAALALLGTMQYWTLRELHELRAVLELQTRAPRSAQDTTEVSGRIVSLDGSHRRGSFNARIVLIEFSDFQCPYCSSFARNTLPDIDREFIDTGRLLLVFRHLPLSRIHPNATRAAQVSDCASEQDRFWQMHDKIFADQGQLKETKFVDYARALGLDLPKFEHCLARPASDKIAVDAAAARVLAVTATPTFFIGIIQPDGRVMLQKRIAGAQSTQEFRKAIDEVERSLSHQAAWDGHRPNVG